MDRYGYHGSRRERVYQDVYQHLAKHGELEFPDDEGDKLKMAMEYRREQGDATTDYLRTPLEKLHRSLPHAKFHDYTYWAESNEDGKTGYTSFTVADLRDVTLQMWEMQTKMIRRFDELEKKAGLSSEPELLKPSAKGELPVFDHRGEFTFIFESEPREVSWVETLTGNLSGSSTEGQDGGVDADQPTTEQTHTRRVYLVKPEFTEVPNFDSDEEVDRVYRERFASQQWRRLMKFLIESGGAVYGVARNKGGDPMVQLTLDNYKQHQFDHLVVEDLLTLINKPAYRFTMESDPDGETEQLRVTVHQKLEL